MFAISRRISWARPQQPSSGYKNGMHGGGTLSGLQLVAFIASKTCCAFACVMQPNHQQIHHHGHHGQNQIART
jgi:hypothetical protein